MAGQPPTDARDAGRRDHPERARLETIGAVAISIAAVAIAWSAYQSTRWTGIMSINFSQASIERAESLRRTDVAGYQILADVVLFSDWIGAVSGDDFETADALRARMDGELGDAMARWLGDWQPGNAIPEGDPFNQGGYESAIAADAAARESQAQEYFQEALDANQSSDNYVLTTVLFASTLFFGGISGRFEGLTVMRAMVVMAILFLAAGFGLMLFEPVTVSL
jgi:hypothetical protein